MTAKKMLKELVFNDQLPYIGDIDFYSNEQMIWFAEHYHQEQVKSSLEISDEEIAKKFPDTIHNCNINKQRGAKWYREQI